MCVGKALTGGDVACGRAVHADGVAETISARRRSAHGPTFMGNPLACAVALASLSVLVDPRWSPGTGGLEGRLAAGIEAGLAPVVVACLASPTCGCSARSASSS